MTHPRPTAGQVRDDGSDVLGLGIDFVPFAGQAASAAFAATTRSGARRRVAGGRTMNTTSLFVELLVVGVGGVIWLTVGAAAFVDTPAVLANLPTMRSELVLLMLGPLTALTYVLGIVLDRVADALSDLETARIDRASQRSKKPGSFYACSRDQAREAKTYIYQRADRLADLFEYGRSRLRICRGSTLNALLLLLMANLFLVRHAAQISNPEGTMAVVNAVCVVIAAGSYWAWRRLVRSESAWLWRQYELLRQLTADDALSSDNAGNVGNRTA